MQTRCGVVTRQAAYTTAVRLPNFYIKRVMRYATLRSCRTRLRRPAGRLTSFMQKSGSRTSPDTPPAATRGSVMSLRGLLCRVAARRVPQLKLRHTRARAASRLRKTHTGVVCDCSSLSPLTLKPLRSPTPRPFAAIATALLSGFAAHAEARPMVTATVASGLGFSVASLPQCRRGAASASIRAVRRLPQGRYAVRCAAARQEKEKRFCKCFCRLFFKQL